MLAGASHRTRKPVWKHALLFIIYVKRAISTASFKESQRITAVSFFVCVVLVFAIQAHTVTDAHIYLTVRGVVERG